MLLTVEVSNAVDPAIHSFNFRDTLQVLPLSRRTRNREDLLVGISPCAGTGGFGAGRRFP